MNTPSDITLGSTYSFFSMRGDPYFLLVQVAGLRKKYFEEAIFKKNSDFQKQTFSKDSVNSAIFKKNSDFQKQTFSKNSVTLRFCDFQKTYFFKIFG